MDVALTSAMRSNLLTLQSTQSGIDKVQGVLASGRKVNSALDNPSSFFAAQSLNNRASDLSRLLDSMGQNISTIKQADKGVSSLTKLVEQADAIANQAATTASGAGQQASVTGSVKLTGSQDVTKLIGVDGGDFELTFEATDENGDKITTFTDGNDVNAAVTVASGSTVDQMIAEGNADRNAHRDALGAIIAARFGELTGAEAAALLAAVPVAHANVNTMADVWAHPQLAARGRWHEVGTPAGPVPALAPPGLVDPAPRMDPVPALGEHTRPILAELGYAEGEIDALRAACVV